MLASWEPQNGTPAASAERPWGPECCVSPIVSLNVSLKGAVAKQQQKHQCNTCFALLHIWACLLEMVFSC